MIEKRIRDISIKASTGWWVIDDVSGAKLESNSYRNLKHTIIDHRKGNDLPYDAIEVEEMIQEQVCAREPGTYCEPFPSAKTHSGQNVKTLTIGAMLKGFAEESAKFAKSGFKMTTEAEFHRRLEICRGCSFWDEKARGGLGKCRKCGCTKMKHWFSTSHCPMRLWVYPVLFSLGNLCLPW